MKEIAENAWNALCEEIHNRRTHGEPDWTPEGKWGQSDELRYEQWLVDHGFLIRKDPSPYLLSSYSSVEDTYPPNGPFTFDFINKVGHYCNEETSGDGAIRFFDMCQRYKSRVPRGVEPNSVLRIPVLVKGAIAQLPKEARKDATILVANILRDYVEDEV